MTTLHARAHDGITLTDALARAGFNQAVALLSSPHEHVVAQVSAGACRTCNPDPYPLQAVFEARVFDQDRELRWLCDSGTRGRAVLLSEDADLLPATFAADVPPLAAEETLETHYLLWGRPQPQHHADWTTLHTPRIGTLHVPVPTPEPDRRLRLVAREYISVEPDHGNAYVSEERLLGIEPTESVPDRRKHA
ncbi:type III-D CRISPR-associated protein Csx19 [Streptomyces sp. NPDC003480]